jgi:purine-cytosine permease-like protein
MAKRQLDPRQHARSDGECPRSAHRRLPDYGIRPVPGRLQRLRTMDHIVLWGSLNVGLLALVAGSFTVPGLGLATAVAGLAAGALAGAVILGAIAGLAVTTHVPGMVLMRAPLGNDGSFVASGLNALQNVGFAVFELLVIAAALHAAVGGSSDGWVVVVTLASSVLVLAGPLPVVRRVLRAIAVPLVVGAAIWLTVWAAARLDWPPPPRGVAPSRF